jgi:predicted outer membrane repeat protein
MFTCALLLGGAVLLSAFIARPAYAATIPVTSTLDSGPGSLRQAVLSSGAGDTILISAPMTITLTSGQIVIDHALIISGVVDGNALPTINGNTISRTFQINTNVNVMLSTLHLQGATCAGCSGGAVYNRGRLTIGNSVFESNSAPGGDGGAIYNDGGTLSLANTTFVDNSVSGGAGGALYSSGGVVGMTNSTLAANSAFYGGAVYLAGGTLSAIADTFAGNSAIEGGGLYNQGSMVLKSTLLAAGPTGGNCLDLTSAITDGGYNLDSGDTCGFSATTSHVNMNPLLAPLGDYGGWVPTAALLPDSPAIDSGTCSGTPGGDARGMARPSGQTCDVGAFESRGFTVAGQSGSPQSTSVSTTFALPLALTITNSFSEPVDGGQVHFVVTEDGSGASAVPVSQTVVIGSSGLATASLTANAQYGGPYYVNVEARGLSDAAPYALTNLCGPLVVTVTNGADSGPGSLRQTIADACPGATIRFDRSLTVTVTSGQISIDKSLTLDGSGFMPTIDGNHASRIFFVGGGINVTLRGLDITNGYADCSEDGCDGGVFYNYGNLYVTDSTLNANVAAHNGGVIFNWGMFTLSDTLVSGNHGGWSGGSVSNSGSMYVYNSTFLSNVSADGSGAIVNGPNGSGSLINTTFISNTAEGGGGAITNWSATLDVLNSTFVGNHSTTGAGGIYNYEYGSVILTNTVLANNGGVDCGVDYYSPNISDGGHNLDSSNTCGFDVFGVTHSQGGIDPLLGFIDGDGVPMLMASPLPGSPAIDAGDTLACPSTDARGVGRVGVCDIGAFESRGFTFTNLSGSAQSAYVYTAFSAPLGLSVTSAYSEPVDGGRVVFTAPDSGPGTWPSVYTATIEGGIVTQTVTANGIAGTFTVTAGVRGAPDVQNFLLTSQDFPCHVFLSTIMRQ